MVRKLKFHEQKLLRKTDFFTYKQDDNHRDKLVRRRYMIQKPEDYHKYNRMCGVSFAPNQQTPQKQHHHQLSLSSKSAQLTFFIFKSIRQLAHRLSLLPPENPIRRKHEDLLLAKLYDMGILSSSSKLSAVENNVTVSAFARRRLPVVMTRLRMAETVQAATKLIEQGHVRVGVDEITDPAYLVTRNNEDFVTWAVGSKIKKNIMKYRDELDDFELL
ncbi:U3 small nucleolar ribonucleoprotein IMP3 [Trichoderma lentiforme]|uniref:U3 small nucleolar ribonucleoprotein protein IMP3 n=1 Tax=Trichoderma lentiforme TaxID=1567552 RepID=A0A9P5CGE9_9HYPO|nr:U3 small nucleolar ribonucleoprotein IMP3 [Trichoderma lentiforme]